MRRSRARPPNFVKKIQLSTAGFVLVDALVSLLITSVVIAVLFGAVSQNLTATERAADRYQAALFARSKLARLGIAETLAEGQFEGRFDPLFSWVLTVSKDQAPSSDAASLKLLAVQLDVRWQRQSNKFQLTYRTRRVAPQKEASAFGASSIASDHVGRPG
jgi:general secretion pathway protein I